MSQSIPLATTAPGSPEPQPLARESVGAKLASFFSGLWHVATANTKVALGSSIVVVFLLLAFFGPLLVHGNPNKYTLELMLSPSGTHWFGTNQGGQDVFGQIVLGARASVLWALFTGVLVVGLAVTIGLISGYFGGWVDDFLSLVTNVFLVIPAFPLAIVALEFFNRSTLTIAIIVALTNWPWGARVLRAQTLSMRSREFVTAAKASGEYTWRILFFELFPNQLSIVAASFITTTIQVLLVIAGLEFLGLGDPTALSWGTMMYNAYNAGALLQGAWWWFAPPGLCIALLGAGLALMNFGIDEVADPRLRVERPRKQSTAAKAVIE